MNRIIISSDERQTAPNADNNTKNGPDQCEAVEEQEAQRLGISIHEWLDRAIRKCGRSVVPLETTTPCGPCSPHGAFIPDRIWLLLLRRFDLVEACFELVDGRLLLLNHFRQ